VIVLVGTVPYDTGVYAGTANLSDDRLRVGNNAFPIERGTAAMAAACAQICCFFGLPRPLCVFGGDVSDGKGTDLMFQELGANLEQYDPDVIVLHYMFTKIAQAEPFMTKVSSLPKKPQLVADAGGMYLLKITKKASLCDVFTPDEAELLFLADEYAPHPLYVRRGLLNKVKDTDYLIGQIYKHQNAPRIIVLKGAEDCIFENGILVHKYDENSMPAMEAIGGTGDTITGMLSGLRYGGIKDADYHAVVLNRLIGKKINCNPATQIQEFIKAIPAVLKEYEKNIR
jgi:ADP-dependent NAD(P)H-hydrate dehydratase / NAD(P)H-hydrate epimerase